MDASLELIHKITYWLLIDYLLIFKYIFERKHSWNKNTEILLEVVNFDIEH